MDIKYIFIICLLMLCLWIHQPKQKKIPKVIHKIYIQHDNQFGNIAPEIQKAHASWKHES